MTVQVCFEYKQDYRRCYKDCILVTGVNAILKQALDRSPAYGSIRDVLESLNADQVRYPIKIYFYLFFLIIYRKQVNNNEKY